jgi:glycosyltransferase involved in cell wall biosynthesis
VDPSLPEEVTIHVVPTRAYGRNISLGRIRYERSFASGFAAQSEVLDRPDLIVLADPSLFFAGPVIAYARRNRVPFILDVLDLWPEMFHVLLPRPIRGIGHMLFAPLYRRRDRLAGQAAAVVAVTGDYLSMITRRVTLKISDVVYLGVDRAPFRPPAVFPADPHLLEMVYAGTLGDAYDMPVLRDTIERLVKARRPVRLTIAGDGPWQADMAALAERFPQHVRFLGKIPADELLDYYANAQIGLATYAPGSTVSMPVKLFDYMAAGLATIGSMQGEAGALLQQGAGLSYQAGSADALVAAVEYYLAHPVSLGEARRIALDTVKQFDQAAQHQRFAILIENVVEGTMGRC